MTTLLALSLIGQRPASLPTGDGYTIVTTLRLVQPYDVKAMNDEFQSAKLLSESGGVGTFRITYRPFHVQHVTADPLWRLHDARMSEYLKPRPAANWDPQLRTAILSELKANGIDPNQLDDKTLVEKVSDWALKRSNFNEQFGLWMVEFRDGKPTVPAKLASSFRQQEPKGMALSEALNRELYGKGMFLNKTHGACTSTSTYMATILRAVSIPTRIILTVPACDPNDPKQVAMLTKAVRHHRAARIITQGTSQRGFTNHVYNEVWVGGKWVRLNYNRLGQPILDPYYCGLMTHVYTADDVSEVPFAKTWGERFALNDGPKLSSVNPFQLVSAQDHLEPGTLFPNSPIPVLHGVTVIALIRPGDPALPSWVKLPRGTDGLLQTNEWLATEDYVQLRDFEAEASSKFLLRAAGHPDVWMALNDFKASDGSGKFQGFGVRLKGNPDPGVTYRIVPQNQGHSHTWTVPPSVVWKG